MGNFQILAYPLPSPACGQGFSPREAGNDKMHLFRPQRTMIQG
jgi:hypothetical protein